MSHDTEPGVAIGWIFLAVGTILHLALYMWRVANAPEPFGVCTCEPAEFRLDGYYGFVFSDPNTYSPCPVCWSRLGSVHDYASAVRPDGSRSVYCSKQCHDIGEGGNESRCGLPGP